MNKDEQRRMDDIYRSIPLSEIPWNNESPPALLVELLDRGLVKPCRAIDLGCGAGNYAVYLGSRGFEVTAIDFSPTAIEIAKHNARRKGVRVNFMVGDVTTDLDRLDERFDFAYDWGLLHHILPADRDRYVANVAGLLNPAGKYLSLCFNEKDTAFEGSSQLRKTRFGGTVYLSSEDELRQLFEPHFEILDFRIIETQGPPMAHVFNYCFMQNKRS